MRTQKGGKQKAILGFLLFAREVGAKKAGGGDEGTNEINEREKDHAGDFFH